jgi:hypothetical protein
VGPGANAQRSVLIGTPNPRADHSLDYNSLTYRDPTGETAVRHLTGDVQICWEESGFTLNIPADQARKLQRFLGWAYSFRMSRKAHVWATAKKEPGAPGRATGFKPNQ